MKRWRRTRMPPQAGSLPHTWMIGVLLGCAVVMNAQDSPDARALQAEAQQLLAAGNADAALAKYQELAKVAPPSAPLEDEIGFLLAATKRGNEAVQYFQHATEMDPSFAQAWYHLGVVQWLQADKQAALVSLEKAVTLAPENADYNFRLGSAYSEVGEYAKAVPALTAASKAPSAKASVFESLGLACQQSQQYDCARDAYRRAIDLDPRNTALRNSYGIVLIDKGDQAQGLAQFQQVLQQEPDDATAMVNIGYADIAAGKLPEAIAQLKKVIAAHPEMVAAHYDLGLAYKQSDDLAEAQAELEKTVQLDGRLAEAHFTLGLVYFQDGKMDNAIEQFRAATDARPDYAGAWNMLAAALKQKGDSAEAIAAVQKSLAINDNDAGAYNTLGLLLRQTGDANGSKSAFAKANELRHAQEREKNELLRQGPARNNR